MRRSSQLQGGSNRLEMQEGMLRATDADARVVYLHMTFMGLVKYNWLTLLFIT